MADRKVIDSIIRIGQQRGEPRKRILAALATGKVESNFQNLSHGDADSQGWRQERASLYKDPTNLQASINRFYDEARKFDRAGLSAGELAARVQRPAAQFRGRYAQALPAVQGLLGGSTPRLLTTKRTVPGELIAGAWAATASPPRRAPRPGSSAAAVAAARSCGWTASPSSAGWPRPSPTRGPTDGAGP
jgi:hypothetical protein